MINRNSVWKNDVVFFWKTGTTLNTFLTGLNDGASSRNPSTCRVKKLTVTASEGATITVCCLASGDCSVARLFPRLISTRRLWENKVANPMTKPAINKNLLFLNMLRIIKGYKSNDWRVIRKSQQNRRKPEIRLTTGFLRILQSP